MDSFGFRWSYREGRELRPGSTMNDFIADDSRIVVDRLAALLAEIPGVRLIGRAGNAQHALRCIEQLNPDAVILDLQMPGGSGMDVLAAIRGRRPGLTIIICTNFAHPQYRQRCLEAGANFFLDKSTEFERIPSILDGLLHSAARPASTRF